MKRRKQLVRGIVIEHAQSPRARDETAHVQHLHVERDVERDAGHGSCRVGQEVALPRIQDHREHDRERARVGQGDGRGERSDRHDDRGAGLAHAKHDFRPAQRIAVDKRLPILEGLFAHAADVNDHNLPLMYWYAAEPLAGLGFQGPPFEAGGRVWFSSPRLSSGVAADSTTVTGQLNPGADPAWAAYWFQRRMIARSLQPTCQITYDRVAHIGSGDGGPMRLTLDRHIHGAPMREWHVAEAQPCLPLLTGEVVLELK